MVTYSSVDPFVVSVVTTDTVDSIASKIVTGLNAAIASKTTNVITFSKVGTGHFFFPFLFGHSKRFCQLY